MSAYQPVVNLDYGILEESTHMPTTLPTETTEHSTDDVLTPLYNCVLLDDDDHSYDYVIEMLMSLFLFSKETAFRHAVEVDSAGRTVIMTAELPVASYAKDQIQGYGKDWRIEKSAGSMTAIVEPATGPGGRSGGSAC